MSAPQGRDPGATLVCLMISGLLLSLALNGLCYWKGHRDGVREGRRLVEKDFRKELDRLEQATHPEEIRAWLTTGGK